MTTEVSLPLTEIAVCPEPDIALNAYSVHVRVNSECLVVTEHLNNTPT